ncbi:RPII140-upstream gene protein [Euwallacea fornicatus]|uniref:RPII140-upstream gene protein n=1 Tax=Euwallacea fornicatus TaxID=995702 RepID=UPI00338F6876
MSVRACRGPIKYGFLPFLSELWSNDKLVNATKTEQMSALEPSISSETGWDRVKQMFQFDEFGNITQEFHTVIQAASMSMLIGVIYGGTRQGRHAYEQFIKNNEATTFRTPLEAKKKLQDAVTVGFGKGSFKWGWRLTLFTTSFVGVSTLIQVYRNKYGIFDYVCAGGITGSLYKFNMGPRGWIVGGVLGSALGFICGSATMGILYMTGLTMEETRYWQSKFKNTRDEHFRKGIEKIREAEDLAVLKIHNDEVGEAGKSLDNLEGQDNRKHIILVPK